MKTGIDVHNLQLRYGKFTAIQNLTCRLEENKIYGLLGRNGSGKTSLLSMIASLRKPTGGHVTIGGEAPFEKASIMRQVCFIGDSSDPYDYTTVRETLAFAKKFRPLWDSAYADELVQNFKLPLGKKVSALSRGMQSALNVTLGLACRAPVTIFDEAYLGMDAPSRYFFYEQVLQDYMAHPRTIILSTHLIEEVASLFEEVLILDRGRLLLHEETDTLRAQGAVVTGSAAVVDAFIEGMTPLSEQEIAGMKSVRVYGPISAGRRIQAKANGLELGPVPLQDLFVHLTKDRREA